MSSDVNAVLSRSYARNAAPTGDTRCVSDFLRSWAWKREHRPDRVRFHKPYLHEMTISQLAKQACSAAEDQIQICVEQAPFDAEGFASTVWDSSIVVSKMFEKHERSQSLEGMLPDMFCVRNRRCLDLSSGCGLVGIVMARLGALVTATDLKPNVPLLQRNCQANTGAGTETRRPVEVKQHLWGTDTSYLGGPFDIVVACDVMYVEQAATNLVATLTAVTTPASTVFLAHGRNRQAEASFLIKAAAEFNIDSVSSADLDSVFQCSDVTVLLLRKKCIGTQ